MEYVICDFSLKRNDQHVIVIYSINAALSVVLGVCVFPPPYWYGFASYQIIFLTGLVDSTGLSGNHANPLWLRNPETWKLKNLGNACGGRIFQRKASKYSTSFLYFVRIVFSFNANNS